MQITPSIHAIKHSFGIPIAPGFSLNRTVYSYLIYGEMITLIDTGVAGCETQIFEYIRNTGRDPSETALIILTHSHPDHIGSARAIQRLPGAASRHTLPNGPGLRISDSRNGNARCRDSTRSREGP